MEVLAENMNRLDLFLSAREYRALLRPGGMLAELPTGVMMALELERLHEGAILSVGRLEGRAITAAVPDHYCDDLLRLEIAEWLHRAPLPLPVREGDPAARLSTCQEEENGRK